MCQQIVQFCSASTKPLVFAGSGLTMLLALGLGYLACSANSLYQDIDPSVAQSRSLAYHLQLLASAYLILISVLACFAAHYDQKHSIRAVAALTSLNFLLAVAAILMVSSGNSAELGSEFKARLTEAQSMYDFKLKPATQPPANQTHVAEASPATASAPLASTGQQGEAGKAKLKRTIAAEASGEPAPATLALPLNGTVATNLWDALQARGCCGFTNSTEWTNKLPKSCCSAPEEEKDGNWICKAVDEQHQAPCIRIIESASLNTKNLAFLLMLALIALVNLYLANVTAISAYRTLHYNEASQSAYT